MDIIAGAITPRPGKSKDTRPQYIRCLPKLQMKNTTYCTNIEWSGGAEKACMPHDTTPLPP